MSSWWWETHNALTITRKSETHVLLHNTHRIKEGLSDRMSFTFWINQLAQITDQNQEHTGMKKLTSDKSCQLVIKQTKIKLRLQSDVNNILYARCREVKTSADNLLRNFDHKRINVLMHISSPVYITHISAPL